MGLRGYEWLIILLVVVILFGGSKLPQLGAGIGKSIRDFKRAMSGEDEKPNTPSTPSSTDQGSPKS